MIIRPRRSVLYVPGSNARAMEKARMLEADTLILDLEDSVAPVDKEEARQRVAGAVAENRFAGREVVVRINALDTPWGRADLQAAAEARPDALLLPKVGTSGDIMFAAADIAKAQAPESVRLWAMIETPEAVLNATALARTAADPASRLDVLVMGTNDLAKDTRVRSRRDRSPLVTWLSICVAAARCHNLDIIDGVYNSSGDQEGLRAECEQGRDFGMDGKTCIHPSQIEICNAVFTPSRDDLAWAGKVLAAFASPQAENRNVLVVDGQMVERLHLDLARRLQALASAIGLSADF